MYTVRIPGVIPARNSIYAHAQDFAVSNTATSRAESVCSTTTEQTTENRLPCALMGIALRLPYRGRDTSVFLAALTCRCQRKCQMFLSTFITHLHYVPRFTASSFPLFAHDRQLQIACNSIVLSEHHRTQDTCTHYTPLLTARCLQSVCRYVTLFPTNSSPLAQWYSTFFVRVPPDIISLQHCTPKVVGT
jgi:hypothetical protein